MQRIALRAMEQTSGELPKALRSFQLCMSQIITAMTHIVQQFEMERRNTTGRSATCQQFKESQMTRLS
jgi:hypothetical protein